MTYVLLAFSCLLSIAMVYEIYCLENINITEIESQGPFAIKHSRQMKGWLPVAYQAQRGVNLRADELRDWLSGGAAGVTRQPQRVLGGWGKWSSVADHSSHPRLPSRSLQCPAIVRLRHSLMRPQSKTFQKLRPRLRAPFDPGQCTADCVLPCSSVVRTLIAAHLLRETLP